MERDKRFVQTGVNSAGDRVYSRQGGRHTPGYEDMTKEELQAELEARGLPKSGNKDELIERLEQG